MGQLTVRNLKGVVHSDEPSEIHHMALQLPLALRRVSVSGFGSVSAYFEICLYHV